jgi:transposase
MQLVNKDMESLEQMEKRIKEEGEIRCPHCDHLQSDDDGAYPISYHGSEDGPEERCCDECGKKFYVRENVRRSYDVAANQEDL